jgi:ribosomal protein L37AE/L43A
MKLRSQTVHSFHQSRPIVPCAQCGEALFAPEWSEHFDDRRIRHVWSCDRCDYQFETLVSYPAADAQAA